MKKTSIKKELKDNKLTYKKKMKQFRFLSYLFVAVLCLGFISCSDDDPTFDEADIIGVWTVVYTGGYDHDEDGEKVSYGNDYGDGDWIFYFDEDGTGFQEFHYTLDFDWTFKNGNKISILDERNEKAELKILSLSASTAVLEERGSDENGKYYWKVTLKKYQMPQ